MDFQHPMTINQLEEIYNHAVDKAKDEINWYESHRKGWRIFSYVVRGVAFLGLLIGVIAPLATHGDVKIGDAVIGTGPQIGYVALAIASIVFAIDQVFMISHTWIRYKNAQTSIQTLLLECEFAWIRQKAQIPDDTAAHEKRQEAISLFEKLVLDPRRVVEEETAAWSTGLLEARTRLGTLLKEQRDVVKKLKEGDEKAREKRRLAEEAPTVNGVKVRIKNHDKLKGTLRVRIGDLEEKRAHPTETVIFERVPFGQHKVVLNATISNGGETQFRKEDLVQVGANATAEVEFSVP